MIAQYHGATFAVEFFQLAEHLSVDEQPAAVYPSGLVAERSIPMRFCSSSVFILRLSAGAARRVRES